MYRGHKIHIARPLAVIASCIIVYAQRDDTYIVNMYEINTFAPDVLADLLIICLCIKQLYSSLRGSTTSSQTDYMRMF
jgi:hypothetical protein